MNPAQPVALIACDNGLGHLRRSAILAKALADRGLEVTLFGPVDKLTAFAAWPAIGDLSSVVLVQFNTHTSTGAIANGAPAALNWQQSLPDLDVYTAVVSDNLPEVLSVRPDSILSGHFFWHHAIDVAASYREEMDTFISSRNPKLIASGFFAAPYLYKLCQVHEVGLYDGETSPQVSEAASGLLISAGTGASDPLKKAFSSFVHELPGNSPFENIYIEPSLDPDALSPWLQHANYTPAMYHDVGAVICRPGVGTLSDSLLCGARVFAVRDGTNMELEENIARIARAGLGEGHDHVEDAYHAAVNYISDMNARTDQIRNTQEVNRNGAGEAADIVVKHIAEPQS